MLTVSNEFIRYTLGVVIALITIIYTFVKWRYQYWKRKDIYYIKPINFLIGNMESPFNQTKNLAVLVGEFYNDLKKKGKRFGGAFFLLRPTLILADKELIKNITIKDFDHFVDRANYSNKKKDPLSANLLNLHGNEWRELRTKLTPTFTSGKMKMMFETLMGCTPSLIKRIESNLTKPIQIKDILECFTTDVIGSCAFGLECKSFEDENSPFRIYGKKIFESDISQRLKLLIIINFPQLAQFLGISVSKKDVSKFFINLVRDTINYRKINKITRNDFLQLLLNQNNFELNEIAAQSLIFFAAGFETSATTMGFTLYNLCKNPDIQEKLRKEIQETLKKYDNKISYEAVFGMKYLGQVIDESLRMFPPVGLLQRKCVKDYQIPNSDFIINKGTVVAIPIFGIHYDEDYYPEPEKFNPDRFENDKNPYVFLPFGEGPRNCIGFRFGLMQARVGLITLLTKYRFTLNSKTQEPIQIHPYNFILWIKGDLWLNVEKL